MTLSFELKYSPVYTRLTSKATTTTTDGGGGGTTGGGDGASAASKIQYVSGGGQHLRLL